MSCRSCLPEERNLIMQSPPLSALAQLSDFCFALFGFLCPFLSAVPEYCLFLTGFSSADFLPQGGREGMGGPCCPRGEPETSRGECLLGRGCSGRGVSAWRESPRPGAGLRPVSLGPGTPHSMGALSAVWLMTYCLSVALGGCGSGIARQAVAGTPAPPHSRSVLCADPCPVLPVLPPFSFPCRAGASGLTLLPGPTAR